MNLLAAFSAVYLQVTCIIYGVKKEKKNKKLKEEWSGLFLTFRETRQPGNG